MTREALKAALDERYDNRSPNMQQTIDDAAEERLAQLREKCEHGQTHPHTRIVSRIGPDRGVTDCPGKAYPPETVGKIAKALFLADYPLMKNTWDGWDALHRLQGEYVARAVAVLDAFGETD